MARTLRTLPLSYDNSKVFHFATSNDLGHSDVRLAVIVLLVALFSAIPVSYVTNPSAHAAQIKTEKKEVKVWVNTASGVYHCPGTRWYGKTKHSEYMSECEAIKKGNRPAYGKPCGSECK